MPKIKFPNQLRTLLEDSDLQAPLHTLADRTGEILTDNKLPFFPDYTDHGTDHVNRVLQSEISLVPSTVWEQSQLDSDPQLLCDADAAVIIGATLLHDIAMHLHPAGLLELVAKDGRFRPLPWFSEPHEGHSPDRLWFDLWQDYLREARRFSDRALANIIGTDSVRGGWKFDNLPQDTGQWERNHCLVIGEFIRRHHARLAHEIAIYGFPGLPPGSNENQFPALAAEGHPLRRLADLIGLTARSHGTSLRVCKAYLDADHRYQSTPRPMGAAVLYPMALLRVADYLQIDRQRAPAVLLQLRNPQSPISVQEWQKHLAVESITAAADPRGKMITVSQSISLELYLQLRDLLASLQAEMDHSTAVLDEAYGSRTDLGLNHLNLAIRRVHSNLETPAFRNTLPYVPERTGFSTDPNLLALLVEPLYGKSPEVAVRELMQNAVDAVRELHAWCKAHGIPVDSLDLPKQDSDVLIDFIKREDGTWFLRVTDKGIGMTAETIEHYFLRAGASFRQSADWAKEFLDEKGQPRVLRAGRFGIGAFAVFLLGPTFRVQTRHAGDNATMGYSIQASAESELIKIHRRSGLSIGTTLEVELTHDAADTLLLESEPSGPGSSIDWFSWDWPRVTRRIVRGARSEELPQQYTVQIHKATMPPDWSVIHPDGFDAVHWTFSAHPNLTCNGLKIADPEGRISGARFDWPDAVELGCPRVAVLDSGANLPLTIRRDGLLHGRLPFVDDLARDVTLSFIAHALICGPTSQIDAQSSATRHPLALPPPDYYDWYNPKSPVSSGLLRWCATRREVIPVDPWLYTLLKIRVCLVYGILDHYAQDDCPFAPSPATANIEYTVLRCDRSTAGRTPLIDSMRLALEELTESGVPALGQDLMGAHVIALLCPTSTDGSLATLRSNAHWHPIAHRRSGRHYFERRTGAGATMLPLRQLITEVEHAWTNQGCILLEGVYVAETESKQVERKPESLIARIWNECLGPHPIPFDPAARRALIEHGRKHPELKRHIEAWEKMKAAGSPYAVGKRPE